MSSYGKGDNAPCGARLWLQTNAQGKPEEKGQYVAPLVNPDLLAAHWLTEMRCDHEAKTDKAFCACGWRGKSQPSVGQAAKDWAKHVLIALADAGRASAPESGWLIEKGQLCLGGCDGTPKWVTFADKSAIRFARKIDAETMLASLRLMIGTERFTGCTVNEHAWS